MSKTPTKPANRWSRTRAAVDGKSAMAEIAARDAFVAKNTVRLRELRLAKEAKDRASALPPEPKAKRKPKSN